MAGPDRAGHAVFRTRTVALQQKEVPMPRKPNYDFERRERERARAAKKAAKAEEKRNRKAADDADEPAVLNDDLKPESD